MSQYLGPRTKTGTNGRESSLDYFTNLLGKKSYDRLGTFESVVLPQKRILTSDIRASIESFYGAKSKIATNFLSRIEQEKKIFRVFRENYFIISEQDSPPQSNLDDFLKAKKILNQTMRLMGSKAQNWKSGGVKSKPGFARPNGHFPSEGRIRLGPNQLSQSVNIEIRSNFQGRKQGGRRLDLKFWNSRKALFCFDGEYNLKWVCSEMALSLAQMKLPLLHENEIVCTSLLIKAFTKSASKQNLLAVKIEFNERFREIIESEWKNGSPSKYFKFKIDLRKNDGINVRVSEKTKTVNIRIKKIEKYPARFNYSQASHEFISPALSKEALNSKFWKIIRNLRKCYTK